MRREDKFGESRSLTRTVALARLELTDPAAEQTAERCSDRARDPVPHRHFPQEHFSDALQC
jgi:hypothetical protein